MRHSFTATIEQNGHWSGVFATEPYEVAWAAEAIFFIRALAKTALPEPAFAWVQISPDGIRWCDEGASLSLPTEADEVTFVRVRHFGGFLRIVGEVPADAEVKVMVYLALKE